MFKTKNNAQEFYYKLFDTKGQKKHIFIGNNPKKAFGINQKKKCNFFCLFPRMEDTRSFQHKSKNHEKENKIIKKKGFSTVFLIYKFSFNINQNYGHIFFH